MDGEDNIHNPSPGGEMERQLDDEQQELHDNMDMEGSQEGGDSNGEGLDDNPDELDEGEEGLDNEEAKDGDGSPVSKKSRSIKKKQSMKSTAQSEAEKSKDLAKEPSKP